MIAHAYLKILGFGILFPNISVFRVRFHYGNSDILDRLFHLTRGGVSKASKLIDLNEDILGGAIFFVVLHEFGFWNCTGNNNVLVMMMQGSIPHCGKVMLFIMSTCKLAREEMRISIKYPYLRRR